MVTFFLGIDYGTKRIGLAVGDAKVAIASPLAMVEAKGNTADHVRAILTRCGDYEIDAYVVGLPLNMDGSEGLQARLTRRFGRALSQATNRDVHFMDERLTSVAARQLLRPAELTRKKRKAVQDAVAAQVMLQSFLDARNE